MHKITYTLMFMYVYISTLTRTHTTYRKYITKNVAGILYQVEVSIIFFLILYKS